MRRPDPPLADRLFEEPYLFDFFQAVRLLEKIEKGRGPVGHDVAPSREAIRFVSHLGLSFPPSPIYSLERGPSSAGPGEGQSPPSGPPRMSTPFMGLIGASGALPTVYTEALLALKSKKRNAAALDFLDLFHHRLISLFYRAWEKYNVPSLWERGDPEHPGLDAFSRHLFDLIGLGSAPLRDRQTVPDAALIFYAGFFAQQHRPAVSLELLLQDHFGHPARVITFFGQWLRLQEDQQSRMGRDGVFNRLGIDAVAGRKVWDDQSKFRVRIGPLGLDEFRDFLPGGRLADELMDLIRFFVRGELDFDVQLVLEAAEVPMCQLSIDPRSSAQLGRTSWIRSLEFVRDADDSVVRAPSGDSSRSGACRW
jgi:type VI secretion system protein ImpH